MNTNHKIVEKKIVIKSLLWKITEKGSTQLILFVVSTIIARTLDPSDYGLISIIMIFISIAQVFIQGGLSTALIQKKDANEKDFSSVFFVQVLMAVFLYIVLFFTSPWIAKFYDMPILIPAFRILSFILLFGAFNAIQVAYISKNMQFKKLMYSNVAAAIISGVIGIIMAYTGFGVWTLIFQQLCNQILICIIMLFVVKWRPKLYFSFKNFKPLFSFGVKLMTANFISTAYNETRSLVIGKKYLHETLGLYDKGKQFPQFIINNINSSIEAVMLPSYSSMQDSKEYLKQALRKSIRISSFLIFPIMAGLAATASPIVSLLLTDKWLPCVPFLQIHCLMFAFTPLQTSNNNAISAVGRSDIYLKMEIIKKTLGILILFLTVIFFNNAVWIAWSGVLIAIISTVISIYPNSKLLNYKYSEQFLDICPSLILSVIMFIILIFMSFIKISVIILLLLQVLSGVVFYVTLAYLFKFDAFNFIINSLKRSKK